MRGDILERNKISIQTVYDSVTAAIDAFESGHVDYMNNDTIKAVDKLLEAQMWLGYAVNKAPKKEEKKEKKSNPTPKSNEDIAKEADEAYRRAISKLKNLDHISFFKEFFEL